MQTLRQKTEKESFVILLATGDQTISEEFHQAFKNTKVELLTFNNARDMLLAMAERPINLVIFDPCSAVLRGVEILSVAKKFRPKLRVVVISDDFSFETQEAMVKEGALYQIHKTVHPGLMSQVVGNIVEKLSQHS